MLDKYPLYCILKFLSSRHFDRGGSGGFLLAQVLQRDSSVGGKGACLNSSNMQVGCDCGAQVTVDKDKGVISVCLSLSMNTEQQSCDQEKGRCGQIFQVGKPLSYG